MIFKCGEGYRGTVERYEKYERLVKNKHPFHTWFAWYPVTVDGTGVYRKCVWLSFVSRRKKYWISHHGHFYKELKWSWEYKECKLN